MPDNFAMNNQTNSKSNMFLQRLLGVSGFYSKKIDGIWGNGSEKAYAAFLIKSKEIANKYGMFDKVSEKAIISLIPMAQEQARIFLTKTKSLNDMNVRIICGTRTYQEQDNLYGYGRTKNGKIVTNAKGGYSWHNFGLAWDVGIFKNEEYLTSTNPYKQVGKLGQSIGLDWGGAWKSIVDYPHFQLNIGKPLSDIRELFESGKSYI